MLRSAGSPDAPGLDEIGDRLAERAGVTSEELEASFEEATLLRRLPMLAEVGNMAALMASDLASPMTGTVADMTCGAIVDWK
jgi:enoyl-[acyl-carrier-protein] reductase (NADH)